MIDAVNEMYYRGVWLRHFPNLGWEFAMDNREYRFATSMAAQEAIDDIYQFVDFFVTKHEGMKLPRKNKI